MYICIVCTIFIISIHVTRGRIEWIRLISFHNAFDVTKQQHDMAPENGGLSWRFWRLMRNRKAYNTYIYNIYIYVCVNIYVFTIKYKSLLYQISVQSYRILFNFLLNIACRCPCNYHSFHAFLHETFLSTLYMIVSFNLTCHYYQLYKYEIGICP